MIDPTLICIIGLTYRDICIMSYFPQQESVNRHVCEIQCPPLMHSLPLQRTEVEFHAWFAHVDFHGRKFIDVSYGEVVDSTMDILYDDKHNYTKQVHQQTANTDRERERNPIASPFVSSLATVRRVHLAFTSSIQSMCMLWSDLTS